MRTNKELNKHDQFRSESKHFVQFVNICNKNLIMPFYDVRAMCFHGDTFPFHLFYDKGYN